MLIVKNVLVHSCHVRKEGRPRQLLIPNEKYISDLAVPIAEQRWFYPLSKSCRCRRYVSSQEATEMVGVGQAVWLLKVKSGALVPEEKCIWAKIERGKVPRVDLISRSDIERALFGSERKSKHYEFNRELKKYVVIKAPEGVSEAQWRKDAQDEVKYEKRIMRDYSNYISEVHDLYMRNRAALIVPFREDPWAGRTIFTFGPDMRTAGGH